MKKSLLSAVVVSLLWLIIPSAHALMINIDPTTINPIDTGNTFNANVNVVAAADLGGFQFELIYNPDVVIVSNVVFSNFLITPGRTVVLVPGMPECDIDNDAGQLTCNRITEGTGAGAYGNGTLVTITFQVKILSNNLLEIKNASLTDTKATEFSVANGKLSTGNGNVQPRYHIFSSGTGPGGSITPSGDVLISPGGSQCFNIQPADCYHITNVIADGASIGAVSQRCFSPVNENHSIQASFAKDPVIKASAGAGGKIEPFGDICVKSVGDKKFTITPDKGFRILELKVDNESKDKINEYTFEKVTSDHTIHADFYPAVLGDIDGSGTVDLGDAILGLRILAGIDIGNQILFIDADVNGDSRIGIEEVLYILQKVAGLREYNAIMGLQILVGLDVGDPAILKDADINGDGKIGIEEVIYFIQKMSGLRE